MVICKTTVRPMDGAVEHPRMDWLRVGGANSMANHNEWLAATTMLTTTKLTGNPAQFP